MGYTAAGGARRAPPAVSLSHNPGTGPPTRRAHRRGDSMTSRHNRRSFLKAAALAGAGFWAGTAARAEEKEKAKVEQINFACIGVGGKGRGDTADAARHGNVVAICDVDEQTLEKAAGLYPK